MVSAVDSRASSLGSSLGRALLCVLGQDTFNLKVPLFAQVYKWANFQLGVNLR